MWIGSCYVKDIGKIHDVAMTQRCVREEGVKDRLWGRWVPLAAGKGLDQKFAG